MAMPNNAQNSGYGYQDQGPPMSGGYGGGAGGYSPQGSYGPQGGNYGPQGGNYGPPPGGAGYNPGGGYPAAAGYGDANYAMKAMSSSNHMNDIFFAAACCIILGATIGGTCLFFSWEPVDWIQMTYLMVFGGILAVLDTPFLKTMKIVTEAKMYIGKYIQFVTRVTGKGVTLVFLGSALFMNMWDNLEGGFMMFLAVVLCVFPTIVGFCSIVIGVLKSSKLDKARRQLQMVIDQRYDHFAQTYRGPQGGLTMTEFNMLTMENGGFKFETLDLKLIFNALVSNPMWRAQNQPNQSGGYNNVNEEMKIPKQDLLDWCKGGMVFL